MGSSLRQVVNGQSPPDDARSHLAQATSLTTGVTADQVECFVHSDLKPLGHDAFSLFDDYAGIQCALELAGELDSLPDGALLKDSDRGCIGQRLSKVQLLGRQLDEIRVEDIHRPDRFGSQPKWKGVHHLEAG
jgi:hypothetical protein